MYADKEKLQEIRNFKGVLEFVETTKKEYEQKFFGFTNEYFRSVPLEQIRNFKYEFFINRRKETYCILTNIETNKSVIGVAKCLKEDRFIPNVGIVISRTRAMAKLIEIETEELLETYN